jgi:uncharacterized damage-inducible protein DinB
MQTLPPVSSAEYAPYYALYIKHVANKSIQEAFEKDWAGIKDLFAVLDDENGEYAYAETKWSVKEVVLHCIDAERIFGHRAHRFMRSDETPLAGYDHERYVQTSNANGRSVERLLTEWKAVRQSTRALFATANAEDLMKMGVANGNNTSVRILAYIITGHNCHHLEILRSKYGLKF